MRRLWLLRYGRPFVLVTGVLSLVFLQGFPALAIYINMFGHNRSLFETIFIIAADPFVLLATAAAFTTVTPIAREAVAWIVDRTSGPSTCLLVRIPLVALFVGLSFSRPDHQSELASRAAAGPLSPEASKQIAGAILGASYFLPLSLVLGISTLIWEVHFLAAAAAAFFTMVASNCLAVTIIAMFDRRALSANSTPDVEFTLNGPRLTEAHSVRSILFWITLTVVAASYAALPYPIIISVLTLAGSIIGAICFRAIQSRRLLAAAGTYFAAIFLYSALIIGAGVLSQLLTISGLPQDFVWEFRNGNQIQPVLIVCLVIFVFSSMFGTLATVFGLSALLGPIIIAISDLSGPWPLIAILLILKISSTLSPLGFINNAISVETPMIRGYLPRLRNLFPVIVSDVIVFALLIAFAGALPQL